MSRPTESEMEQVLCVPVQKIDEYCNHWRVKTASGKWIAKRIRSKTRLKWWLQAEKELRQRGFTSMPRFLSDQKRWLLMSFIEGQTMRYTEREDVVKKMKTLGHLHNTGQGLSVVTSWAPSLLYHRLYQRLVQYYQIMKQVHNMEGELGKLLKVHGHRFYIDGLQAWEQLCRSGLLKVCHEEHGHRCITHRDLASHNWITDSKGHTWLIDFDTADYDCQIGDLWQISSRILSENNWCPRWANHILCAYECVKPLSPVEKQLIHLLMSFPNEFFRESIGLMKQKRGYTDKRTLPYLHKLITARDTWQSYVKNLALW